MKKAFDLKEYLIAGLDKFYNQALGRRIKEGKTRRKEINEHK